jgi:predicted RNA-binding Zn-ribbon protein involved in translation (DUF1610 family)
MSLGYPKNCNESCSCVACDYEWENLASDVDRDCPRCGAAGKAFVDHVEWVCVECGDWREGGEDRTHEACDAVALAAVPR